MDNKICRLCCLNAATTSIFSKQHDDVAICAKVMYCCTNVTINEDDGLPSYVCGNCEQEVNSCYQFVLQCEESDRQLRSLIISQVKAEFNDFKAEVKTEPNEADHEYLESFEFHNRHKVSKRKCYKKRIRYNASLSCKCSVCGRKCANPSSLMIHMRSHTNEKPFSCPTCDKKYKDGGTLKRHIQRNHLEEMRSRNFICENCGKSFFSKHDVKIHMRTHTGETPYACPECPSKFTQISTLLRHKRRHTGAKDHICQTCNKRFCTKEELKSHLVVHTNERNYSCPICNITLKYRNNLNKHMRLHSEPNRFVCNYCGRTFNAKGNLKLHINRQHSEKSGHCNICAKNVSNLEVHMWRHTGERPLKCELCTSSFFELKALGHHINFKHKKTDKYKCESCTMSFPSRPMLEFHTVKLHSNEIPFPCDRCSRGFYRKNDLARHKIGTHKERLH